MFRNPKDPSKFLFKPHKSMFTFQEIDRTSVSTAKPSNKQTLEELNKTPISNKGQKPTYYIYIICCVVALFFFIILICMIFNKKAKNVEDEKIDIKIGNLFGTGSRNCETTKTYCFEDNDCAQKCSKSGMSCIHGVCSNNTNITDAENICNPEKGVIGYLVGNTALGTYEYICKSIDPAIAISVDENRMCHGDDTYQINYLSVFPSIYSCKCPDQITVPATSQKREHVECNSTYKGLIPT
jgi:hypothetical protein